MPFFAKKTNTERTETFEYTIDRYYYTSQQRFEQSIDVYKPLHINSGGAIKNECPSKIPVVLVMGSGWLGHKPYVYVMTNWWNSSAPKQICGRLGHTCISIRHSGGYMLGGKDRRLPVFLKWLLWKPFLLVGAAAVGISAFLAGAMHRPAFDTIALISTLSIFLFVYMEGRGAAEIEDMVSDVSAALEYIDDHALEWGLGGATESKETDKTKKCKNIPIVFGGYSSGAHVAATLLTDSNLSPLSFYKSSSVEEKQRPLVPSKSDQQKSTKHQSHKPKHLTIRSVLYISGVLDVSPDSFLMSLLSWTVLRKSPSEVPSPLRALVALFGDKSRCSLPPHILIGCKHEVFGWSILDSAFCASEYANVIRSSVVETESTRTKIDDATGNEYEQRSCVRLILLENWTVNHWSILSSAALRNALGAVLSPLNDRNTIAN